jgi:hypothetical protein
MFVTILGEDVPRTLFPCTFFFEKFHELNESAECTEYVLNRFRSLMNVLNIEAISVVSRYLSHYEVKSPLQIRFNLALPVLQKPPTAHVSPTNHC